MFYCVLMCMCVYYFDYLLSLFDHLFFSVSRYSKFRAIQPRIANLTALLRERSLISVSSPSNMNQRTLSRSNSISHERTNSGTSPTSASSSASSSLFKKDNTLSIYKSGSSRLSTSLLEECYQVYDVFIYDVCVGIYVCCSEKKACFVNHQWFSPFLPTLGIFHNSDCLVT